MIFPKVYDYNNNNFNKNMDAAARRAKRAKELQEKKKKLEMLRRKRRERDQKHATSSSSTTSSPAINKQQTNNESIDDLVDNILSTPPPPSVLLHTKQNDNNKGTTSAKRSILSQEQDMNNGTRDDESKTSVDNNQDNSSKRRPPPVQLTQQSFEILNIPSTLNTVSYSKSVQTTYTGDDLLPKTDRDDDENNGGNSNDDDGVTLPKSPPPRLSSSTSIASIELDVNDGNINNNNNNIINGTMIKQTSELNEQEKESIINSTSFQEFFKRTSAICERALNDTFDPTISYGASATEETIDDIKECLILEHTFYDQKFSSNRAISDINWNPHYKELFLTSMVPLNSGIHHGGVNDISNVVGPSTPSNSNNSNSNGSSSASNSTNTTSGTRANNISNQLLTPNGIVLVWSLRRPKTPEYVFTTQSAVTCALFDRFSTNFILGATYSGQIVLWDMRASNRPVQRSPLSADCHTHPVFNAKIVGTTNNHEVITVSTDGRLCTWNLGQLDQPAETMMLKHGNKDIAVTNMAFPPSGDNNTFFCGSEDGCVYTSQVHSNKAQGGTKKFEGHYGPITGMDFASSFNDKNSSSSSSNSNINNINNGKKHNNNRYDRLLTSSMDWTVKLYVIHIYIYYLLHTNIYLYIYYTIILFTI